MLQGGIEGGLVDAFRFGDTLPAPLDSRLRENDGSYHENDDSYANVSLSQERPDMATPRSQTAAQFH